MRIGIDFDNTIVCYDNVFYKAALLEGLIPESIPCSKGAVRDYLRSIGKEKQWTQLQGAIYGARMDLAHPFPGVGDFFQLCQTMNIDACIISHKTLYPYLGPRHNLHESAKNWLSAQNFPWTPPAYFELTLQEKLARIADLQCTVFIDDLPELLAEKNFPPNVDKILFDPHHLYSFGISSWEEISKRLWKKN